MSCDPSTSSTCDYCGLPVAAVRRPAPKDDHAREPVYCCLGCRMAASIVAAEPSEGHARRMLIRLGLAVFCAMNVMVFSMALWSRDVYAQELQDAGPLAAAMYEVFRYTAMLFAMPVLVLLGGPVLAGAWQSARQKTVTTDLLILLGVVAAYLYSVVNVLRGDGRIYFDVGAMVLVFVTLGRWFEANSKLKTSQALDALAKLLPERVHLVRGDVVADVPRDSVTVGDTLRVLAGERFAVDGRIAAGTATVDQQLVTGESRTVTKAPGDPVYSGTLNIDGDLRVEVTAAAGEETVSRLLALVREARRAGGQYQRLADRIARWFVPAVCLLALATAWWHGRAAGLDAGILAGLAVVLIACPCAIGLATPMAVWTAMGRAAQCQVLFRSGQAVERLAAAQTVFFDKTGTLTSGDSAVTSLATDPSTDRREVLRRAVALASGSTHEFSAAIRRYAGDADAPERADVATVPGKGVWAWLAGGDDRARTYLGSRRFVEQAGLAMPDSLQHPADAAEELGQSLAYIGWDGRVRGAFVFREQIRPEASAALAACRAMGLQVAVLTGDHQSRARRLQAELGAPVITEQLPEDKVAAIDQARHGGSHVVMVGDGINDAPALAAADTGVALGCGADLTRDAASVCLLSDNLALLPWTVALARQTVRIIHLNLFWAFAYNSVGIALAVSGRLNPVWAGAAMVVSSLLVVTTSLRLNRFPPAPRTPADRPSQEAATEGFEPSSEVGDTTAAKPELQFTA